MSSSILYRFRSGTTFEALPLPGTSARLFDVKKGIVKAKRLDVGGMDFELEVHDASTNQQYVDESMLLPRGTRLIVRRVGAARGQGIVARMQRAESGMSIAPAPRQNAPSGFYTIESNRDDEDEFVPTNPGGREDEKELAALMAATEASQNPLAGARHVANNAYRPAGSGPPPQMGTRGGFQKTPNFRPNADPELRAQEQQQMPKKRATGIPRTFLNLSAPPVTDGSRAGEEGAENVPRLQPNALGFEELVNRGGGQSENATGTKRDLDYALKLTATTIPEHLQCAICHGVVKNAMLLPWDPDGRTTCETCIRDALAQSGFVCPLTGIEGVSPDDLLPNQPLRKAADLFVKGVMEKMDEIDKQQVDEPDEENTNNTDAPLFEGDAGDKGVIVSKKTIKDHRSKRQEEDDPFGGEEDPFGGDVFDVKADEKADEKANEEDLSPEEKSSKDKGGPANTDNNATNEATQDSTEQASKLSKEVSLPDTDPHEKPAEERSTAPNHLSQASPEDQKGASMRRDARKPRGPPPGYVMGPAGGAAVRGGGFTGNKRDRGDSHFGDYGRGAYGGRGGRHSRGRGRGRYYDGGGRYVDHNRGRYVGRHGDNGVHEWHPVHEDVVDDSRGTKRNRNEADDTVDDRYRRNHDYSENRDWGREPRPYRGDQYDDRWNSHQGYRGRGRGYRGRGGYGRGRF